MKRARKGFTLVELLIVIAIIGILTSMAMMGGSEANNVAQANKIIEEMRIISAAMNMYYADNRQEIESSTSSDIATNVKGGIAPYMKDTGSITAEETGAVGKYNIVIQNPNLSEWWLCYTLPGAGTKLANILANKADSEGLKKTNSSSDKYVASATTVYMQVR